MADQLKEQAREKVMAFWLTHGIDAQFGGYWTDLARNGQRYGEEWSFFP